jgi:hypothetical protein
MDGTDTHGQFRKAGETVSSRSVARIPWNETGAQRLMRDRTVGEEAVQGFSTKVRSSCLTAIACRALHCMLRDSEMRLYLRGA